MLILSLRDIFAITVLILDPLPMILFFRRINFDVDLSMLNANIFTKYFPYFIPKWEKLQF